MSRGGHPANAGAKKQGFVASIKKPGRIFAAGIICIPNCSGRGRPRANGSPDDVRGHLSAMQAEGDMFEALDDAEMDWLTY
jgi:hypothetical protein